MWGSTFIVTKGALRAFEPASLLMWRFALAAAVLVAAGGRRVRALSVSDRRHGTLLGLFLATGFLLQTWGLQETLAGVSAFLTGLSILLTPVAAAVLFGERIGRQGWAAVVVGAFGLLILAGGVTAGSGRGAIVTVAGAVAITGHICGLSQWATRGNGLGLTAWSVTVAATACGGVAWVTGGPVLHTLLPGGGLPENQVTVRLAG